MSVSDKAHLPEPASYLYGHDIAEAVSAAGVSGDLCRGIDGRYFFRVYGSDGNFTDYELCHDDLPVTISKDALASFYVSGKGKTLDHSPSVLGLRPAPVATSAGAVEKGAG